MRVCKPAHVRAEHVRARACVLTFSLLNFQKQTRLPVSSAVRGKFNAKKPFYIGLQYFLVFRNQLYSTIKLKKKNRTVRF